MSAVKTYSTEMGSRLGLASIVHNRLTRSLGVAETGSSPGSSLLSKI